jgi:2-aminobenzoate-CoA ligase
MFRSGHVDTFCRDNLPPAEQWPDLRVAQAGLAYPERLNVVSELLDAHILAGNGHRPALISADESWSYGKLAKQVNRIANVLVRDMGMVPGNRVLLRAPNCPMLVACYLAVLKAGGVAVATMPMLRARELVYPIAKAQIGLAFADSRFIDELQECARSGGTLQRIVAFGNGELEGLMAQAGYDDFVAADTAQDDVCIIGFTSGTTGEPKGTLHFHRDLLAICDCYGAHVLRANENDRFIGSPPLAFTFGLGGLVLFPMRVGASTILIAKTAPPDLLAAIAQYKATICFTAPTAYRAMLDRIDDHQTDSLRVCISAGEALPKATFTAWLAKTGLPLMDGIGATEMLHIFISAPRDAIRPGATGLPVPGYEARIIDEAGEEVPDGKIGRLAMRGPTGCRYLSDDRQAKYVANGWNISGDSYLRDTDGYFWYQSRSDDMIVSSGYNIAGPEVEASLLLNPAVAECGVVGAPDPERGMIVKAYVVLAAGYDAGKETTRMLRDHVKADIAPFKYPRDIVYVETLPKTQTGKLQRFALRQMAEEQKAS